MQNLIKRNTTSFKAKDGWYCEVNLRNSPRYSNEITDGEEIYIAENGYAIFAKGIISEKNIIVKNKFEDFVRYALLESKVEDNDFWFTKMKKYAQEKDPLKITILEYKVTNTELLEFTIPLEERFLKRQVWYREEDFKFQVTEKTSNLTKHIPTKIRRDLWQIFNINLKDYTPDIDHFVPVSLNGPGNIIENLVPMGKQINRSKSDKVPSKLFELGKKFNIKVPKHIIEDIDSKKYFNPIGENKELAKKIIEKINKQSIEDIRKDYKYVRDYHIPSLTCLKKARN